MSELPAHANLRKLEQLDAFPDRYRAKDLEVYLYCPNGYGRTKLSNNTLEKLLSVEATTRNWNTVNTLVKLLMKMRQDTRGISERPLSFAQESLIISPDLESKQ